MSGTRRAIQFVGNLRQLDEHGLLCGIHFVDRWNKHHIRQALQLGTIRFQRARVFLEVLVRAELQRIHENARHHAVAMPACEAHQIEMSLMQVAHGRHESDGTFVSQSCT